MEVLLSVRGWLPNIAVDELARCGLKLKTVCARVTRCYSCGREIWRRRIRKRVPITGSVTAQFYQEQERNI